MAVSQADTICDDAARGFDYLTSRALNQLA